MRLPGRRQPDDAALVDPHADCTGGGGDEAAAGQALAVLPPGHWQLVEQRAEVRAAARTRRAPLVGATVTLGVGIGAWGSVQLVAWFLGPGAVSTAQVLVFLGTLVAVPVLRALLRDRIDDAAYWGDDGVTHEWVRTWWASTGCAAVWVNILVALGAGVIGVGALWMLAILVVGAAALGASWAEAHAVPDPGDDVEPEPEPEPEPEVEIVMPAAPVVDTSEADEIERAWDARVAAGQNPIATGSVLTDLEPLPHGWRWIIELDPDGSVGCTALEAEGTDARVALKLVRRSTHVMVERLEDDPGEHLAMLTVITRDVLAAGVPYTGPRYDNGVIAFADYADGTGQVDWQAYDETGVLCGLITGGQGSGKSQLMAALGLAYRWSGEWSVLFGDGDENGNSSHLLAEAAHNFARGSAEVLEQLEGIEAWGRYRGDLMATLTRGPDGRPTPITQRGQRPIDKFMPSRAYHGLVWFLDEFHRLAQDPWLQRQDFVPRVAKAVRILRKYGGSFVIGTQSALGADFDGDSAFRSMIAGGNTIAMRNKNKSEQGIVTDGISPHLLPKGGGYGLQGDGPRRAMLRVAYSEDADGVSTMYRWLPEVLRRGQPDGDLSWAAFSRHRTVAQLDPAADYDDHMDRLTRWEAAFASGAPLPGSAEARAADGEERAPAARPSGRGFAVPSLTGNVVPIRPDVEQPPAPQPVLRERERRVLNLLRSRAGAWRTAELEEETGLSKPDVSKAGGALVGYGLAHRPNGSRGIYAAGPQREADAERDAAG